MIDKTGEKTSAQHTYKLMLRDQVAPALRALGLKGSGNAYSLPDDRYWALIGLQGHRYNDAREARFTVNLTVVAHDVWARAREAFPAISGSKPTANEHPLLATPDRGRCWVQRIGLLMPDSFDRWWRIRAGEDTTYTALEVVEAIRRYGLPALREQINSGI